MKVRTQPYPQIPVRTPVAPAFQTAPNLDYNSLRYPPPPFRNSAARLTAHVGRLLHLQVTRTLEGQLSTQQQLQDFNQQQ